MVIQVFYEQPDVKFMERKQTLRKKNLHQTNKVSDILSCSISKDKPSTSKDSFYQGLVHQLLYQYFQDFLKLFHLLFSKLIPHACVKENRKIPATPLGICVVNTLLSR